MGTVYIDPKTPPLIKTGINKIVNGINHYVQSDMLVEDIHTAVNVSSLVVKDVAVVVAVETT